MYNDQSEQLFTREQVGQIIEEMSRKLNLDRSSEGSTNLPNEILEELENSSSINLQKNIKEFVKNIPKYEGSEWFNSEIFNKEFHRELKRETMDALQSTNAVYKGADRLIIAGRAAINLYEECQQFLESGGSEEQFFHIMEGIQQLAVYSYATSKITKSEARTMAIKALRLADSVKHLEEDPSDKAMALALGREEAERIFQARYEQSILKNAVGRQQQSLNHNNRGFGRQQRYTRGRGTFHRSFFGRSKGQIHTEAQSSNQPQ
ncbi:hypothetical protein RMATCC62417_03656 [Rhizopus microsporus]|nr:hypothetical protein RMATCC62417_03656 [Rhizopus microsporus]